MTDESSLMDAVSLFVNTAQRMNTRFIPSEIEEIHAICRRLQGIPLAIEMAASWTGVYPCSEILNMVTQSSLHLTSRYQDIGERHRSLQAVFESTWERLSPHEQPALMRLAIFHGDFSIAVLSVAAADKTVLALLQEKMLVHPQNDSRLVLHEMIRQLALQKLVQNPAEWPYDCFVEVALVLKHLGDTSEAMLLLEYCSHHPECFQPVRDRAADYLHKRFAEILTPNRAEQHLFPVAKQDVTAMLLKRLRKTTDRYCVN